MTFAALLVAVVVAVVVIAEIRVVRVRRVDRVRVLDELARAAGIINAVKVGRALGWLGDDDVRGEGDAVRIRVRRRWR